MIFVIFFSKYDLKGNYPDGHGKLDFSKTRGKAKKCIKRNDSILGLPPPDIVETNFREGLIGHTVNLTWLERKLHITSYANNGQLNGMFKAHDKNKNRWMIGVAMNNKLMKSFDPKMNCWIIENKKVIIYLIYLTESPAKVI